MLDFLGNPELITKAILIAVIVNAVLSGASMALEKIKDLTATETDNKIHAALQTVLGWLSKIVDFLSANRAH